ncbi:MAG: hypothetical protein RLO04_02205 [Limnobacter sp.]|uniref:hypothetical protein n=1 Tax=Limnobacter sp. TaxID=2003368 RepID=UPI0032EB96BA
MGPQVGLYPVSGAAGLLAAILTHAAIANGVQSSDHQQAQQASDRVLDPYATVLGAWSAANLWDMAVAAAPSSPGIRVWDGQTAPGAGSVVQTAPTFTLAPDESVVILDVAIKLAAPGVPGVETIVRVVSSPLSGIDPRSYWSADEAHQLKSTAAAMLAHAIGIAHHYANHSENDLAPMRTHRYMLGNDERTERAQKLMGNCARLELRNLRGFLMSVPIRVEPEANCLIKAPF